jgi:hypothetical protein
VLTSARIARRARPTCRRCFPARFYLLLQPRYLGFQFIQPSHEPVDPPLLHRLTPLPLVHQQSEITGSIVPAPANPEQLDLELSFVQSSLRLFPKRFELMIEPVEDR